MPYEIGPLRNDELDALRAFLIEGFGAPADALFAAREVLRWKFLAPRGFAGEPLPRSLVARDESGRLVGHVGFVLTTFCVAPECPDEATSPPLPQEFSAVHMIDWLGSPEHRGVGGALLRRVNALAEIQYGFGGTEAGRTVIKGAGFEPWPPVPVYECVLRARHALRDGAGPVWKRLARAARDAARIGMGKAKDAWQRRTPTGRCELARLDVFDHTRVEAIRASARGPLIFSARPVHDLNALLACAQARLTGWQVRHSDVSQAQGYAVLGVVPKGPARIGKIVELFLTHRQATLWRDAFARARDELYDQQADVALAVGSTPWEAEALEAAGFQRAFELELSIRDRARHLTKGIPFHVSFIEADYAYLP